MIPFRLYAFDYPIISYMPQDRHVDIAVHMTHS